MPQNDPVSDIDYGSNRIDKEEENTLSYPINAVDDNDDDDCDDDQYETADSNIGNTIEYHKYKKNSTVDLSIVEEGKLPEEIIKQLHESNKELQESNKELREENCCLTREIDKLKQDKYDHEKICKNPTTQSLVQAQNQLGTSVDRYPMDKYPHGLAVLIINSSFHSTTGRSRLLDRNGSLVDEENLRVLWKYLNYEVVILKNRTASDLINELEKIASQSHESYDSFVCFISSHNYPDGIHIYAADGELVNINNITALFTEKSCPTLRYKPKLFFITGCRLQQKDGCPITERDFLVGYATLPGKSSYRNPENGSYYISTLCKIFKAKAKEKDLTDMLDDVCDEMTVTPIKNKAELCSEYKTTLCKKVWFFPSPLCDKRCTIV